ncbi:Uu.00g085270.m01.CDS01 [Anthostomella pinea]|uniref:Nucleoside diphosphate kinase n=1 Tax=Anthostomella pinea TaxID=933095 RepID=A0AAI8VLW2_9PEZI|nr:Uu.00g085270.m01.CDS01 [Anthostomella pinea]
MAPATASTASSSGSTSPKPNHGPPKHQIQPRPRRGLRHPALCVFFTTIWLVFFLLFILPWQVHDRQGWNFSKSVKHDYNTYKGALGSLFTSPASSPEHPIPGSLSVTTTPPSPDSILEKAVPEPEFKMSTEQTFIAIKPDGVQRGLVGSIIGRFEARGYKLVAIKLTTPGKAHLEKHYEDLSDKPFFAGLVEYMNSGPICAMVWEGRDAVKTGRTLLGATNPLASAPGTIRGDFAIDVGRNVCHGSDSVENAKKEIALWFKEGEVQSWESAQAKWIYEKA